MPRLTALMLTLVLVVAACSGDDGDATTTTADGDGTVTSLADTGTVAPGGTAATGGDDEAADDDDTTTTIDLGAAVVPEFEIVSREEAEDGDTVVIVLDQASYDRLTDIDIQNVAARLVEDFPPVSVAHVVDDDRVSELVLTPEEADEDGQQLLDLHYLASLDDGRLTFRGPFESSGVVILGS